MPVPPADVVPPPLDADGASLSVSVITLPPAPPSDASDAVCAIRALFSLGVSAAFLAALMIFFDCSDVFAARTWNTVPGRLYAIALA